MCMYLYMYMCSTTFFKTSAQWSNFNSAHAWGWTQQYVKYGFSSNNDGRSKYRH